MVITNQWTNFSFLIKNCLLEAPETELSYGLWCNSIWTVFSSIPVRWLTGAGICCILFLSCISGTVTLRKLLKIWLFLKCIIWKQALVGGFVILNSMCCCCHFSCPCCIMFNTLYSGFNAINNCWPPCLHCGPQWGCVAFDPFR